MVHLSMYGGDGNRLTISTDSFLCAFGAVSLMGQEECRMISGTMHCCDQARPMGDAYRGTGFIPPRPDINEIILISSRNQGLLTIKDGCFRVTRVAFDPARDLLSLYWVCARGGSKNVWFVYCHPG